MRKYKRKRPSGWADKDQRMILAARLRDEGKSLRQAARVLGVTYETVRRDLARWDAAAHGNVIELSQRRVTTRPARGRDVTPGCDTPRTTGEAMGLTQGPKTVQQEWADRAAELLSDWR